MTTNQQSTNHDSDDAPSQPKAGIGLTEAQKRVLLKEELDVLKEEKNQTELKIQQLERAMGLLISDSCAWCGGKISGDTGLHSSGANGNSLGSTRLDRYYCSARCQNEHQREQLRASRVKTFKTCLKFGGVALACISLLLVWGILLAVFTFYVFGSEEPAVTLLPPELLSPGALIFAVALGLICSTAVVVGVGYLGYAAYKRFVR